MKKILLLFFHPRFEDSRVNQRLLKACSGMEGLSIRDMYELYPDFDINIPAEQEVLLAHDVIVWQHPFYWYNCPPLMKQWIDLVLEYGWAYGKDGDKLAGKWIMNALSSGGTFEVYRRDGRNRFTYRELLSPFDQTAHLCHMEYLPPFIVPGANRITDETLENYATQYREALRLLQADDTDIAQLRTLTYFNEYFTQGKSE